MYLDINDSSSIEQCVIQIQGSYDGYFIYEDRKVGEKFSLILKYPKGYTP